MNNHTPPWIWADLIVALAVFTAITNGEAGETGSDAIQGAEAGAAVGSVVPGIGTLIGGLIGGGVGALSSAFGGGAKDPETESFYNYVPQYNKDPRVAASMSPADNFQYLA